MLLKRVFVVCAFLMHAGFLWAAYINPPKEVNVTKWSAVKAYLDKTKSDPLSVTRIDLTGRKLKEIPSWVFEHTPNVETLNLNNNAIEHVSAGIGQLRALKELSLFGNRVRGIHGNIRKAENLTRINLGNNDLHLIPDGIYGLPELRELIVSRNNIARVSPAIGGFTKLVTLDLSKNPLQSVPHEIGSLHAMKYLLLSNTHIDGLPQSIKHLAPGIPARASDHPGIEIDLRGTNLRRYHAAGEAVGQHGEIKLLGRDGIARLFPGSFSKNIQFPK